VQSPSYELLVHDGAGRGLYTVKNKSGRVMAACISESRLRLQFPEVAESNDMAGHLSRTPQVGYVQ
jgi:hypothetical protein